jgi:hypothetical protein
MYLISETHLPYPEIYQRLAPQAWYYNSSMPLIYPPVRGLQRNGVSRKNGIRGRGRCHSNTINFQQFNPHEYNEQYYKYFANLVGQDYHAFIESDYERSGSSSCSRSRRRSRSKPRSQSKSKLILRSRSRQKHNKNWNNLRPHLKRQININAKKRYKLYFLFYIIWIYLLKMKELYFIKIQHQIFVNLYKYIYKQL